MNTLAQELPRAIDHAVMAGLLVAAIVFIGLRSTRVVRRVMRMRWIVGLIAFGIAAMVLAASFATGRPLARLWLDLPDNWRSVLGVAAAAAWLCVAIWLRRECVEAARECEACRHERLAQVGKHTISPIESAACGASEELVFRAFVPVYLVGVSHMLGHELPLWAAMMFAALLFGVLHARQGLRPMIFASIAGGLLGLLVLFTGSLWGAMLIHATQNLFVSQIAREIARMPKPRPDARHVDE